MTRFAYIRRDGRCVLRADGHADFCPGRDIVCAGASALMCALAGALDALGAQGVQRTLDVGYAAIAADDRADVRAAFTVAVTGLRQILRPDAGKVRGDTQLPVHGVNGGDERPRLLRRAPRGAQTHHVRQLCQPLVRRSAVLLQHHRQQHGVGAPVGHVVKPPQRVGDGVDVSNSC